MEEKTRTIIIEIKGGLVRAVYMDQEVASGFDVRVLDWDIALCNCEAERQEQADQNGELSLLIRGMADIY